MPIFMILMLFYFKDWVRELFDTIKTRIAEGSEMSVGPGGFSLGSAPKLESEEESDESDELIEKIEKVSSQEAKKEVIEDEELVSQLEKSLRLIHGATYNQTLSEKRGRPYYRIQVELVADNPDLLDSVEKIVYHLHPTFPNPDREINTRHNNFQLSTSAWGQFNLRADVYFKDITRQLRTSRYINF